MARDFGPVLKHGEGPGRCDYLGARDVWVWAHKGRYYMHYDGAGPKGWLACLATSTDLVHWTRKGPVLDFGRKGSRDSGSASYATTFLDGGKWHGFYVGTPNTSGAPDFIPSFPYLTMKSTGKSPTGPWTKQYGVATFSPKPGTYYGATASPGHIVKQGGEYLMFFSASTQDTRKTRLHPWGLVLRTIGIARTRNLDGAWTPDPDPVVPLEEQIENSSLYYEKSNRTWFLFTNHVGIAKDGGEYTDAIWVYWSRDINRWNPADKALVLDSSNCKWSKGVTGLPSVLKVGRRLAIFYDGRARPRGAPYDARLANTSRDVGLAWLDLPLRPPA